MKIPSILINEMLSELIKKKASSLHLSIGSLPCLRIDGDLETMDSQGIVTIDVVNGIINSFIDEEEVERLKQRKELILVKEFSAGLRFRVNIFYQKKLPALSFFYISNQLKTFDELSLPKILNNFLQEKSGLFVIAGSYGAGKTTTINALFESVNKNEKKYLLTIEDPIEFVYTSKKSVIVQREIGSDVDNARQALKSCLKEDVDIVGIGEISDDLSDYISILLDLASGNSLVFLEMNANNSINVIEKLINATARKSSSESARYRISDVLKGVIVQKLLPRKGGGVVLAYELIRINGPIKSLIRENKTSQIESIIQTSKDQGMMSMDKSIKELQDAQEII